MAVLFCHIVQSYRYFLLPPLNSDLLKNVEHLGGNAVSVFFTLSGFLITYLLLLEKHNNHSISIRKFYMRRILRIWPLYYLYLFIAVAFATYFNLQAKSTDLFFYFFMAGNVPFILHDGYPFLVHYWSLGVEEQFYLIWPFLINIFNKGLLKIMVASVCIIIIIKAYFFQYYSESINRALFVFLKSMRFENMIIGALLAFIFQTRPQFIVKITNKYLQIIAWVSLVFVAFEIIPLSFQLAQLILSVATCLIIAAQLTMAKSLIKLENTILNFLGKISFGIYVYHPLVIYLVARIVKRFQFPLTVNYVFAYLVVIAVTLGVAYISYEYFEKRFLKIKHSFAVVNAY